MIKIYIASDWFTHKAANVESNIVQCLESVGTYEIYRPRYHTNQKASIKEIKQGDMLAIEKCDIVLANLTTKPRDSGTVWEIGFAQGIGKEVVVFDLAPKVGSKTNLMLATDMVLIGYDELIRWARDIKSKKLHRLAEEYFGKGTTN